MRIGLMMVVVLFLAGCVGTARHDMPVRFLHQVAPGTLLTVEQAVKFSAGDLRVYFQDGKLYQNFGFFGRGGVNRYRPYCALELAQKPDSDLELSAREFRLETVSWDVTYEVLDISDYRTQWRLSATDEPQPYALVCYKAGNAAFEPHLTLDEMTRAVGKYLRLVPAAAAPDDSKAPGQ